MFLSQRERPKLSGGQALTGPVTVPGDPVGAYLEGERRGVTVFAPGGYHWVPALGDEVLVLKSGENGERPCAVGVASQETELGPGEVLISAGKCGIRLSPEGGVQVFGMFSVNGTPVGPQPEPEKEDESGEEEP